MARGKSKLNSTFAVLKETEEGWWAVACAGLQSTLEATNWVRDNFGDSEQARYLIVNVKKAISPKVTVVLSEEGGADALGVAESPDEDEGEDSPYTKSPDLPGLDNAIVVKHDPSITVTMDTPTHTDMMVSPESISEIEAPVANIDTPMTEAERKFVEQVEEEVPEPCNIAVLDNVDTSALDEAIEAEYPGVDLDADTPDPTKTPAPTDDFSAPQAVSLPPDRLRDPEEW